MLPFGMRLALHRAVSEAFVSSRCFPVPKAFSGAASRAAISCAPCSSFTSSNNAVRSSHWRSRAVLRRDSEPECALSEEIELTRSYVALEQMRFADRLRVTFEIGERVQQAMVPCFLMQPLLENAIKHGLRGVRKTGVMLCGW
jgi:hypothetical protein